MRSLKIDEISGVDVPAQQGAVALIMKRKDDVDPKAKRASQTANIDKAAVLTSPEDGHSHLLLLDSPHGELVSGNTEWADDHYHPWIKMGGGEVVIGTAHAPNGVPHIHRIAFTSKGDDGKNEIAGVVGIIEEDTMSTKTGKTAELTVEELQEQLAHSQFIASLTDAEKAHYKGLFALDGDKVAKVFLNKSAEDRKTEIEASGESTVDKTADEDPVEYTTLDGIELRKSVGAAFIAMAKSNDAFRKKYEESEAARDNDRLEKRAETELPHLPGTTLERAALLKAVEGIEDEGQRTAALAALTAQNESMASAFKTNGYSGGSNTPATDSGETELKKLAEAHQVAHPDMTYEAAYSEVLKTTKGGELYAKSVN